MFTFGDCKPPLSFRSHKALCLKCGFFPAQTKLSIALCHLSKIDILYIIGEARNKNISLGKTFIFITVILPISDNLSLFHICTFFIIASQVLSILFLNKLIFFRNKNSQVLDLIYNLAFRQILQFHFLLTQHILTQKFGFLIIQKRN